jgi:hypothetical protein
VDVLGVFSTLSSAPLGTRRCERDREGERGGEKEEGKGGWLGVGVWKRARELQRERERNNILYCNMYVGHEIDT